MFMPKPFKLIKKKFSKVDQEWQWTYTCLFTFIFNKKLITQITITDHYQKEHPEITNELILKILEQRFNGKQSEPTNYPGLRKVFKRETTHHQQSYRLVFWFKDGTDDHLWIRNCYPID